MIEVGRKIPQEDIDELMNICGGELPEEEYFVFPNLESYNDLEEAIEEAKSCECSFDLICLENGFWHVISINDWKCVAKGKLSFQE